MKDEGVKIPVLNYHSMIMPESIEKILHIDGEPIFNVSIEPSKIDGYTFNGYVCESPYSKYLDMPMSEDTREHQLFRYIQGFREGYFHFKKGNKYQIVNLVTEDHPLFVDSWMIWHQTFYTGMFPMYGGIKEDGTHIEFLDNFHKRGKENGKKYKALEVVLDNPFKYEKIFDKIIMKHELEEKGNEGTHLDIFKSDEAFSVFKKWMNFSHKDSQEKKISFIIKKLEKEGRLRITNSPSKMLTASRLAIYEAIIDS
jgi:hypothetical protein